MANFQQLSNILSDGENVFHQFVSQTQVLTFCNVANSTKICPGWAEGSASFQTFTDVYTPTFECERSQIYSHGGQKAKLLELSLICLRDKRMRVRNV